MNTHTDYRRQTHRPAEQDGPPQVGEAATSELAHRRDPSLVGSGKAPPPSPKGIAWVRPTDLAAYAAPMVGRGIDLHAELIRRARRGPATATRAIQRSISHPASPTPSATRTEGPSL